MKNYLLILPVALLVTYSQIIVKWRVNNMTTDAHSAGLTFRLLKYLADPFIFSGYASALLASVFWLYVVTKLPLTVAFPVYIGITFLMVLLGGIVFLSEAITLTKLLAVVLILAGIALGLSADA